MLAVKTKIVRPLSMAAEEELPVARIEETKSRSKRKPVVVAQLPKDPPPVVSSDQSKEVVAPPKVIPISQYYKEYTVTTASTFPALPLPAPCVIMQLARKIAIFGATLEVLLPARPGVEYIVNADGTFRFVNGVLQANDQILIYWTPTGFGN